MPEDRIVPCLNRNSIDVFVADCFALEEGLEELVLRGLRREENFCPAGGNLVGVMHVVDVVIGQEGGIVASGKGTIPFADGVAVAVEHLYGVVAA